MRTIKDFRDFLNESKAYSGFDVYSAEEYFANLPSKSVPDCIPVDIREWSKLEGQLNRMSELIQLARVKDPKISKYSTDKEIKKYVLNGDSFKHSIFEINADLIKNMESKYFDPNLKSHAEELEHLGFPIRLTKHIELIRSYALQSSAGTNEFKYDKRKDAEANLINDVKKAKESGVDISKIIVECRINTGGNSDYKGGVSGFNGKQYYDTWTKITKISNSNHWFYGTAGWCSTIFIAGIDKLYDLGVRDLTVKSNKNICGAIFYFPYDKSADDFTESIKITGKFIICLNGTLDNLSKLVKPNCPSI